MGVSQESVCGQVSHLCGYWSLILLEALPSEFFPFSEGSWGSNRSPAWASELCSGLGRAWALPHSRGLPKGQAEWAAGWAFRERCRGWLRGGVLRGHGQSVGTTVAMAGETARADGSLRISEEAEGGDGGGWGWRGCGDELKGTMSGCRDGWPR